MTATELKPCPNPACSSNSSSLLGWEYFQVDCNCGVSGPRCKSPEEAARGWNNLPRAEPEGSREPIRNSQRAREAALQVLGEATP